MVEEVMRLDAVEQFYVAVDSEEDKFEVLCDLLEAIPVSMFIIYCNTRRTAAWLADKMGRMDLVAGVVHAEMDLDERRIAVRALACGAVRVLVSTEPLARAIQDPLFPVFINLDLPTGCEEYSHRVGHTSTLYFGRKRLVFNILVSSEMPHLREIEELNNTQINETPMDIGSRI